MQKTIVLAAAIVAALTAGAWAQGEAPKMSPKDQVCKADVEALCRGQKGGEVLGCLMTNAAKIQNATCQKRIQALKAKDAAIKQACASDISADKCEGMDIGTGLLKCLGQNRKSLSADCKAELKKGRMGRRAGKGGGGAPGGEPQPEEQHSGGAPGQSE